MVLPIDMNPYPSVIGEISQIKIKCVQYMDNNGQCFWPQRNCHAHKSYTNSQIQQSKDYKSLKTTCLSNTSTNRTISCQP